MFIDFLVFFIYRLRFLSDSLDGSGTVAIAVDPTEESLGPLRFTP